MKTGPWNAYPRFKKRNGFDKKQYHVVAVSVTLENRPLKLLYTEIINYHKTTLTKT